MIDFRYHLVSLIAVFLAVALGIVIGTTQLNGSVLENLQTQVTGLQEDKRALEDTTQSLQTRVDADDQFSDAIAPAVVGATLTDRNVVVLVADDEVADETVDDLTDLLGTAGASVTGTIRLTPAYSDPSTAQSLQSYVTGPGRPAGLVLPESSDAGELVAAVLGQVLMRTPSATTGSGSGATTACTRWPCRSRRTTSSATSSWPRCSVRRSGSGNAPISKTSTPANRTSSPTIARTRRWAPGSRWREPSPWAERTSGSSTESTGGATGCSGCSSTRRVPRRRSASSRRR